MANCDRLLHHTGASNFTSQHIQELRDETEYKFHGAFEQIDVHPL